MVVRRLVAAGALVLLVAGAAAFGAETYEGSATVGGFDEFPHGMYGATRLVPPYSVVSVRNLANGRTVRITVTDHQPAGDAFLVLAPAAAESLGIPSGDEAGVALTEVRIGATATAPYAGGRWSSDPDLSSPGTVYPPAPMNRGAHEHIAEDARLELEPAEPRPPVPVREDTAPDVEPPGAPDAALQQPEPALPPEPAPPPPDLPIIDSLDMTRYYVQIGSYANRRTVRRALDSVGSVYPVVVLAVDREEQTMYQVLVGPLERDETGALQVWLRANGYPDVVMRGGARR